MLFLLAGYEIEIPELVGRGGGARWPPGWRPSRGRRSHGLARGRRGDPRRAGGGDRAHLHGAGTLLPILKDSGMLGTTFGDTLMKHGAYGELGPIVAISVLLGSVDRSRPCWSWPFALLAVLVHLFSSRLSREGSKVLDTIRSVARRRLRADAGPARRPAARHAGRLGRRLRPGLGAGRLRGRHHPAPSVCSGQGASRSSYRRACCFDPGLPHLLRPGDSIPPPRWPRSRARWWCSCS